MLFQKTISTSPFKQWLWHDKENQHLYWFALIASAISFSWLKMLYPYPNFMPPDSFNYLEAAYNNLFINIWPIGYSKFLRLVAFFSHSHLTLVIVQYILLQNSVLYFMFSIRYLLAPSKWQFRFLFVLTILNPLLVHIANFISSDCLFTALSIIWCIQLLWIIYRPTLTILLVHAVVILLAFMVRYNALYFPFISVAIIAFINMPKNRKWAGVSTIAILLLTFIGRTQYEYHKKTDTVQYAAFGGWQMAANALYAYAYTKPEPSEIVPVIFRDLHKLVNQHVDSLNQLSTRPDREIGTYYLWDFKSPLRTYMEHKWKHDSTVPFFKKWASMAPLYGAYGRYLTSRYPIQFLKYYIWPNLQRYYTPPSYFMGKYNMGNRIVEPIAMKWFRWKRHTLITRSASMQIPVANVFTILMPVINVIFITALLSFIGLAGFKHCNIKSKKMITCILVIWTTNTIFSVLSAPIELRYQLFPFVISSVWAIIFVAYVLERIYFPQKIVNAVQETIPAGLQGQI